MKRYLPFLLLILVACVDPFSANVKREIVRYVVEGGVTDQGPPNTIRITSTANFTTTIDGIPRAVSGATVQVCDDAGNCIPFYEFEKGLYETQDDAPRGEVGKSYHVEITLADGKRLQSYPEKMLRSPTITKGYYEFDINNVRKEGFQVMVDVQDPGDEKNYYKWESITYSKYSPLCFNKITERNNLNILSDKNQNGNKVSRVFIKHVPYTGLTPFVVEVYQLALSARAHEYLSEIKKQTNSTGSIFDPPPSFIRGNLYNPDDATDEVLGYFLVAGVSRNDILVDRSNLPVKPDLYEEIVPKPCYCWPVCIPECALGGCACIEPPCPPECHYEKNRTSVAPDAWPDPHDPCWYG